jgi:hypothetical protein
MKKLLKRFALALAILIAIAGTLVWLVSMDIAPQDVSDLTLLRPQPSPPSNGYTYFLEATRLLTEQTNKCLTIGLNKPVDTNSVLKVLESNEPAIALIEKATQCSHFRQPDATLTNVYNHISTRQFMAKLLSFKIKFLLLSSGRYEESVQTGVTSLKIGNMHLQDSRCSLDFLTSSGLLSSGLSIIRNLAVSEGLSSEQLTHLAQELNNINSVNAAYRDALKGEFRYMATAIDKVKDGTYSGETLDSFRMHDVPQKNRLYVPAIILHPNRTKNWIADNCRARLKEVAAPYSEKTKKVDYAESKETWLFGFKLNLLGCAIQDAYSIGVDAGFKKKCKLESEIAATRLVVACHLYRLREGKLPHTLQELVPAYLPEIPVDPYDGKPFRYKPEKNIVYSVGEDLIDSDGAGDVLNSSGYPIKRGKDLVYSLAP